MSGGYHDKDIITGHKKHVKRLNSKKDWGAELDHYRKNYTAVRFKEVRNQGSAGRWIFESLFPVLIVIADVLVHDLRQWHSYLVRKHPK